ncbi:MULTISPECIES: 2-C-methyl-D-erythritol 2,4-cyclodiphosphate synthase [unclassified Acinetobacter]|uniref:2-C-methyl-D-erythritol 2,4-cyclodiphosphate synthase n=1 Tax=unclassified Acinetobacter TaxID=196816 RepID=UPI002934815F|nr:MULTISPECIES: 2-C-methyl-D-erythritol 2,4-cyclodiphosphate synthase [unclassified Acinetobacter]WOE32329.1 2-C-methyl-D-erythritol 2,4-cyclodiphosphate synthase [Acinetobacter sp. SAAs470]WOE37802.1 2-C-methyl-D-erythritol 2,4-cyclodiphosphate synthase [Acinetobacter sp. SAAs474]
MNQQIRIGQGIDVHAFEEGSFVTLAGIRIPHSHGLKAHSDGDVVLHALCDALLGALALGDIGQHFPDTDAKFKGIDSTQLLQHVYQLILDRGYLLNNADITVACERPKLAAYHLEMRQNIANIMNVDLNQVSIKATTTEKLGFTGRQEGILATATVLIRYAK